MKGNLEEVDWGERDHSNNEIEKGVFINQRALCQWLDKIDVIDAAIISAITRWCEGKSENIKHHDGFTWVDYGNLLDGLPILRIGMRALKERIRKIVSHGILLKRTFTDSLHHRSRAYFMLSKAYRKALLEARKSDD